MVPQFYSHRLGRQRIDAGAGQHGTHYIRQAATRSVVQRRGAHLHETASNKDGLG